MSILTFVATSPDAVLDILPPLGKMYGAALLAILGFIAQRAWKLAKIGLEIRDEWRDSKREMIATRRLIVSDDGKSGFAVDLNAVINQRLPELEGRVDDLEELAGNRRHQERRTRDRKRGDSA